MITFSDGSQTFDIEIFSMHDPDGDEYVDILDPAGYPWDPDKETYLVPDLGVIIQRCFEWKYGRGEFAGKDPKEGQPGHRPQDRYVCINDVTHGRD